MQKATHDVGGFLLFAMAIWIGLIGLIKRSERMTYQNTASCSCGQLKVALGAAPIRRTVCHCLACQKRTGSVFAMQARFARSAATASGAERVYVRTGDEGGRAHFHFCPDCGATVYYEFEGVDDLVVIPIGALDDPYVGPPDAFVYAERKHDWVVMPVGTVCLDP